ncbi:MAG: N-formylglutamate deformylase [Alphaproteobacteria bacterium]|nr:N-formylglutamate deformylase [Alphaproteobacteria bacterium]
MSALFRFEPGNSAVLLSVPHVGTGVPDALAARLTPAAAVLPDTDWHVDRLYDGAAALGIGLLSATHSRYVIDLNRDPANRPLYPGQETSGLCPQFTFDGEAIYRAEAPFAEAEVAERLDRYWRPYHAKLAAELAALKARHGFALLIDAHSIRSQLPRLFKGRLPDFNFGTVRATSAANALAVKLFQPLEAAMGMSAVRDGRFIGGYITRHYGAPAEGIHAVQLEIAQIAYMEEKPPFRYRPDCAAKVKPVLRQMLEAAVAWAPQAAQAS